MYTGIIDLMDMSLSKLREMMRDRGAWRVAVCAKSQAQLSDGTATKLIRFSDQ